MTEMVGVAPYDEDSADTFNIIDKEDEYVNATGKDGSTIKRIRANLACIETSKNFFINGSKWHGILGLGYPVIARPSPEVTPFMESLTEAKALEEDMFALKLCGTVDTKERVDVSMGGSLDLG